MKQRPPKTAKQAAMRSRRAKRGGMARKKQFGSNITLRQADPARTLDSYRYN